MKASEHDASERQLIEAAQRDPGRFAELYETNFDRVYAFVARRVPGRDDAEDLTAEVFHQALACLAEFEWRGTPFVGWLLGIAAHLVARRWQSAARQPEVLAEEREPASPDRTEQAALLAQLVDRLPRDQRHVMLCRFVEQRSIREIAEQLGRSEGAVKQLQFRALETLRNHLRNHHA